MAVALTAAVVLAMVVYGRGRINGLGDGGESRTAASIGSAELGVVAGEAGVARSAEEIKQRRRERAKRARIARETRAAEELATAAIPVSEQLAETRGHEGHPAAARPDLEMIRAKGGAPLTAEEAVIAGRLVLEEGKKAMATGDVTLAFEHLFRATELHGSLEAHATLGDLLLRARQAWRADYHLEKAAQQDPENPDRWVALANAYSIKPDPHAASQAIKRAKELEPDIVLVRDDGGLYKRGG